MRTNKLCEMVVSIRPSLCTTEVTEEGRLAIYGIVMLLDSPCIRKGNNVTLANSDQSD